MSLSNWTHWLRPKLPIMPPFFAAPNNPVLPDSFDGALRNRDCGVPNWRI
jgi:hypothetical protein